MKSGIECEKLLRLRVVCLPSCTFLGFCPLLSFATASGVLIPVAVWVRYDVTGVSPDKIQNILEQDWIHLLHDQRILDSPNYLHEQGRPVVALWGVSLSHGGLHV